MQRAFQRGAEHQARRAGGWRTLAGRVTGGKNSWMEGSRAEGSGQSCTVPDEVRTPARANSGQRRRGFQCLFARGVGGVHVTRHPRDVHRGLRFAVPGPLSEADARRDDLRCALIYPPLFSRARKEPLCFRLAPAVVLLGSGQAHLDSVCRSYRSCFACAPRPYPVHSSSAVARSRTHHLHSASAPAVVVGPVFRCTLWLFWLPLTRAAGQQLIEGNVAELCALAPARNRRYCSL